jgi:hypothetical protein
LAIGQLKEGAAVGFGRILPEYLVEATTAGKKVKCVVEDQEGFRQSIDDRQRKGLRLCTIAKLLHLVVLRKLARAHGLELPG